MTLYPGYKGRCLLIDSVGFTYNLSINKFILAVKSQEEDATTAVESFWPSKTFVASRLPRVDVQLEGFWSSTDNPFGAAVPLLCGFNYAFQVFFDKSNNTQPNVNSLLLITGCEVQSSVRDLVRFTVTGVLNAPTIVKSGEAFSRFFPLS